MGAVLKGSLREFRDDELTDRPAALTYHRLLSLFPALLVPVSLLGLTGRSTTNTLLSHVQQFDPGSARDIITGAVSQLMPEGRPVWKILPVRVGLTVVLLLLAVVSALIVVFTGALARTAWLRTEDAEPAVLYRHRQHVLRP